MNRAQRALALFVLSLSFLGLGAAAQTPDVILYNGKVFTSDPDNLWAQAVAVEGRKIQAVGANAAVLGLAGPETRLLDPRRPGRAVPGHLHRAFLPAPRHRERAHPGGRPGCVGCGCGGVGLSR